MSTYKTVVDVMLAYPGLDYEVSIRATEGGKMKLLAAVGEIERARGWIRTWLKPTERRTTLKGSGINVIQAAAKTDIGPVGRGVIVAAMLLEGYEMRAVIHTGREVFLPTVFFNVSASDIRRRVDQQLHAKREEQRAGIDAENEYYRRRDSQAGG
jgi:hypothetical protein